MSYEEAKGALDDLYSMFDRDELVQQFGTVKNKEEFTREELGGMKIEGFLGDKPAREGKIPIPITEKYKRFFCLVMAFSEFSEELFGKNFEDFGSTFHELKERYSRGRVDYGFIKKPRFLKVFRKKLDQYI